MGKGLEKAQKQYWYDSNFDKSDKHFRHQIALNNFESGWKAALEWMKTKDDPICDFQGGDITNIIEEELNAKT